METEITKHFTPYKPKAREEYMNPRQLAHFRGILESLKGELSKDIDRTVHTMQDEATIFADPNDRASQVASMGFDAAVWELWPYLTAGASIHIIDEETRFSPAKVREFFDDSRISI